MKKGKCDYCSKENAELRSTPYMADIGIAKKGMCKECWHISGTIDEIGEFNTKDVTIK